MVQCDFLSPSNPVLAQINTMHLTISLSFILFALCVVAYFLKWLSFSGAIAAFFTALILGYGGLEFFYLPMLLLIGGTLLSKLNKHTSDKNGRNAKQVLANGSIGLTCLILYYNSHNTVFFIAYLLSFSVSICDTFSSEIGKFFKGATIDILTLKPITKGLSGGISIKGTIGGFVGAMMCSLIAILLLNIQLSESIAIGLIGFIGMLVDSLMGSIFQAKYKNIHTEAIEEDKNLANKLIKGYAWCSNDLVNLLSNAITVILFIAIQLL